MLHILHEIESRYAPSALVVYGSYADGSSNANSDFDALALADIAQPVHDVSFVDGIQLDLFVYPKEQEFEPEELLQIHDGTIVLDQDGRMQALQELVRSYVASQPKKSHGELRSQVEWCRKMLLRTQRGDAEGFYRWHWVLCDSLEIWADLAGQFYFGPKKTIRRMESEDPVSFRLYEKALTAMQTDTLTAWIDHLSSLL